MFEDDSERLAWDAVRAHLRDDDALLHGLRITDPEHGEVEIDLLVLMPDRGAVVIEVKGGLVTFANGGFQQSGARGTHPIDPVRQARNGVYALRRYLRDQPAWSRGPLPSAWLLCFPYTAVHGAMGPEAHRDLIVDRSEVTDLGGRAFDRMTDPRQRNVLPRPGWVAAALELLIGRTDLEAEVQARTAGRLHHADQLTEQQAALLTFVRTVPRFEVTGSAGTGKTWLAMEQARRWAADGERVCVVSYGRGVAEHVRRAMADLPSRQQPAFIGTFHQLGATWGVVPGEQAGQSFWDTTAPAGMLAAARQLPEDQRFTAFVVDEAQDFADEWWPALLASALDDGFRLAVFRDDEQSVFTHRRGHPELALTPLTLGTNMRNARQIVDTFRPLVTADIATAGGDGFPVEFVACPSDAAHSTADAVAAELFDERGWLPEQIALLTTKHRHAVQAEQAADRAAYWDDLWGSDVFYSTVGGFKGLERPVVVLAVDGFHDGVDPRSVMYAGMSRARDLLIVVGDPAEIESAVGDKVMRRLHRGAREVESDP